MLIPSLFTIPLTPLPDTANKGKLASSVAEVVVTDVKGKESPIIKSLESPVAP